MTHMTVPPSALGRRPFHALPVIGRIARDIATGGWA